MQQPVFLISLVVYLLLLIYLYLFYRSNNFKENFFFFKFFKYRFFLIDLKRFDFTVRKRFGIILLSLLFFICFILFLFAYFNDLFSQIPNFYPNSFGLAKEEDVFEHLLVKKKLIDELLNSNQLLEILLKEQGMSVPTDLDTEIKKLISANQSLEMLFPDDYCLNKSGYPFNK